MGNCCGKSDTENLKEQVRNSSFRKRTLKIAAEFESDVENEG